jgi:hypothetical protein
MRQTEHARSDHFSDRGYNPAFFWEMWPEEEFVEINVRLPRGEVVSGKFLPLRDGTLCD